MKYRFSRCQNPQTSYITLLRRRLCKLKRVSQMRYSTREKHSKISLPYRLLMWSRKMITLMGAAHMHTHSHSRAIVDRYSHGKHITRRWCLWQFGNKINTFNLETSIFLSSTEKDKNEKERMKWNKRKGEKRSDFIFPHWEWHIDSFYFCSFLFRPSVISTIISYANGIGCQ